MQGLAWIALFPVAYVFPDGRFVPAWSRWPAAAWAAYLALGLAGVGGGSQALDAVVVLILVTAALMALIPTAVAVAVLRHRLFDLDVWINRALVYGVLTAFVVAAYAAVVGGIGALWADGTGGLLTVVAAATVALAFSPLRERVQRHVNRLVYGERGDPYVVLSRLGQQLGSLARPEVRNGSVFTVTKSDRFARNMVKANRISHAAFG